MKQNISDKALLAKYREALEQSVTVRGKMIRTITRADGSEEVAEMRNIVTAAGLNELAAGGVTNTTSAFLFLAIGTATAAHSLGSVQGGIGEVDRKTAAIAASSNEVIVLTMTWAGAADSITSVVFGTGAAFNHPNSGSGVMLNAVNSVATTLADSDFLKLQAEIQVGSHAL